MSPSPAIRRIVLAFAAGLALLLGAWAAAGLQAIAREGVIARVNHAHEVLIRLDDLALQSEEAESEGRRYLSNNDRSSLAGAHSAILDARRAVDQVRVLTADDPNQQKGLGAIGPLLSELEATISSVETPFAREAFRTLDRDDATRKILSLIGAMQTNERFALDADTQKKNQAAGYVLLIVALFCSVALMLMSARWVKREFQSRATADKALATREEQYRQVVEMAGDMIVGADCKGRFTFCNQTLLTMLHYTSEEIIGRSWLKLVSRNQRRTAQRFYLRQAARNQKSTYFELPLIDGHGKERWVGQSVQLIQTDGKITGFQAIAREITERKRAEIELEQSRNFIARIASTTPGILYVYDIEQSRLVYNNHEAAGTLGGTQLGDKHQFSAPIVHPEDQSMVRSHHASMKLAPDGEVRHIEYRARHLDGHWIWLSVRETAFERGQDRIVRKVVGIAQDVTERKVMQDKLTWQANFDALTGLANRHHFRTRLEGAIRRAVSDQSSLALCLFDIDQFKKINDQFGHAAGDEVLEKIGTIVRGELRANDFAARLGGDEFCFALPGAAEEEAATVAERIRDRLNAITFGLSFETQFSVTATFGVADCYVCSDARALLEAADQALYAAKEGGRNRVRVHAA